jgi:hypothetical protein
MKLLLIGLGLSLGAACLVAQEVVELEWTNRSCGHRDGGTPLDYLNPFRPCPRCQWQKRNPNTAIDTSFRA